jgi:uncharacterized protein (TIGR03067 family)
MRPFAILVVGVVALLGVGCGTSDKDAVQGTWTVESLEDDGEKAPADEIKNMKITLTTNKFVFDDGKKKQEETYSVDPATKPKGIDVTRTRQNMISSSVIGGPAAKPVETKITTETKTVKGIYSLEGDSLKICLANPDKDRPTDFSSKEDRMLMVLKRAK